MSLLDKWVAPTTLALTRVGTVEISTVHLGSMDGTVGKAPYETCLCYDSEHMPDKIVGSYATEVEALRGHIAAIKKQLNGVLI